MDPAKNVRATASSTLGHDESMLFEILERGETWPEALGITRVQAGAILCGDTSSEALRSIFDRENIDSGTLDILSRMCRMFEHIFEGLACLATKDSWALGVLAMTMRTVRAVLANPPTSNLDQLDSLLHDFEIETIAIRSIASQVSNPQQTGEGHSPREQQVQICKGAVPNSFDPGRVAKHRLLKTVLAAKYARIQQEVDDLATGRHDSVSADLCAGIPRTNPGYTTHVTALTAMIVHHLTDTAGAENVCGLFYHPEDDGAAEIQVASAVTQDLHVRASFSDGILWYRIGRGREKCMKTLLQPLARAVSAIAAYDDLFDIPASAGDFAYNVNHYELVIQYIAAMVRHKSVLVVLEDVWSSRVIDAFRRSGVKLLCITSSPEVATTCGRSNMKTLPGMTRLEALDLSSKLTKIDGPDLPQIGALQLAEVCDFNAHALAIASAAVPDKGSPALLETWTAAGTSLDEIKARGRHKSSSPLSTFAHTGAAYVNPTSMTDNNSLTSGDEDMSLRTSDPCVTDAAIQLAFDLIDAETQTKICALGLLAPKVPVSVDLLANLWMQDPREARMLAEDLHSRSLLYAVGDIDNACYVVFHRVVRYARQKLLEKNRSCPTSTDGSVTDEYDESHSVESKCSSRSHDWVEVESCKRRRTCSSNSGSDESGVSTSWELTTLQSGSDEGVESGYDELEEVGAFVMVTNNGQEEPQELPALALEEGSDEDGKHEVGTEASSDQSDYDTVQTTTYSEGSAVDEDESAVHHDTSSEDVAGQISRKRLDASADTFETAVARHAEYLSSSKVLLGYTYCGVERGVYCYDDNSDIIKAPAGEGLWSLATLWSALHEVSGGSCSLEVYEHRASVEEMDRYAENRCSTTGHPQHYNPEVDGDSDGDDVVDSETCVNVDAGGRHAMLDFTAHSEKIPRFDGASASAVRCYWAVGQMHWMQDRLDLAKRISESCKDLRSNATCTATTDYVARYIALPPEVLRPMGATDDISGAYSRALCEAELVFGDRHAATGNLYTTVAIFWRNEGQWQRAEVVCRRALDILVGALGQRSPTATNACLLLVQLLLIQGRAKLREAEGLSIRFGFGRHYLAGSIANLAVVREQKGARRDELIVLYTRATALSERASRGNRSELCTWLENLATLFFLEGRLIEGTAEKVKAFVIQREGTSEGATGGCHDELALTIYLQEVAEEVRTRSDEMCADEESFAQRRQNIADQEEEIQYSCYDVGGAWSTGSEEVIGGDCSGSAHGRGRGSGGHRFAPDSLLTRFQAARATLLSMITV